MKKNHSKALLTIVGAAIKTGVFPGIGTAEGLLNPLRAEIHLVTRSHGSAFLNDPVMLNQQLNLFNGGCPPNTCVNLQASIHRP
jgi:hypothetical protein